MKAIIYKDLISLKDQRKNFLLSLIFTLLMPVIIKHGKLGFLETNLLFLAMFTIVPLTICLQFSNYSLLSDKKDIMLPLIFCNNTNKSIFFIGKAIFPLLLSVGFNVISFIVFKVTFEKDLFNYNFNKISIIFVCGLFSTIVTLFLSELLLFIVNNDVYYPTVCIILSFTIVGGALYLINPFNHLYLYLSTMVFIAFLAYFLFSLILNKKYAFFERGKLHE